MNALVNFLNELNKTLFNVNVESRLAQLPARTNEYGIDMFGFEPEYIKHLAFFATLIYRKYFRTEVFGINHIPDGRVLIIANHSGQLPIDAFLISTAILLDKEKPRMPRSMVERWVPTLPYISVLLSRWGQVLGTPDNCRRLLNEEECILVFPEGAKGISKTWKDRYQLQDFGFGFLRLALETKTPIVPVAVIGGEESIPSLYNFKLLANLLRFPAFPITPTFPWLFPIGILPYPVKFRIYFGAPIQFQGDPNDEDAVIEDKVNQVKGSIQKMIHQGLKERKHIFW